MRTILCFIFLLLPLLAKADFDAWGAKLSTSKAMQVYWLNLAESDLLQNLLEKSAREFTGFSWQEIDDIEQLTEHSEEQDCTEKLLIWQGNDYQESVLLDLAKQGINILVVAEAMPVKLQKQLASFGSFPAWLDSEQEDASLHKQIEHRVRQLHNQRAYRLANMQIKGLHLHENFAFLYRQKPSANQRWFAEIYALTGENVSDEEKLWLHADGRLLEESALENKGLSDSAAQTISIAEYGELPLANWQNIFPSQHSAYANLQTLFDLETPQQLYEPLLRFLKGESIYQQKQAFLLVDSPQYASLALKQNSGSKLFYQSSDGALHQWNFLANHAYQWQTIYPNKALTLSPDLLWDIGERGRFYSGQLSAVQNQRQNKAWLFASSGLAEQGVYGWDVSGEKPRLAWHKTVSDLPNLAWMFNKLTPLAISYSQQEQQAVLFGAGFDPAYLNVSQGPELANQGNAAYMLDAGTGNLLWQLRHGENIGSSNMAFTHPELKHPIAASFSLNQKRDTAFVGDMGGQLWRISLPKCKGSACLNLQYRQQHWRADVIAYSTMIESGFFHAVALWEKPNQTYIAAINSSTWQESEQAAKVFFFPDGQITDLDSLPNLAQCEQLLCTQGWYYQLAQGEKLYADPVVWQDNLYFLVFKENPQSCSYVADTYTLYRFNLNENGASVEIKPVAEGSLYLAINKNNIAALAPAINRWLSGSEVIESMQNLLESFDNETEENGIVVTSWREYFY